MKNNLRFLVFLFCCLTVTSVWGQKISVIQVNWQSPKVTEMHLFEMKNASVSRISSSVIGEDGNFVFAFFPKKEGFYFLGENPGSRVNRYVFYLKPGDNLQLQIDDQEWKLVGKNSVENQEMEKWYNFLRPLEKKAVYYMVDENHVSFDEFFPQLEAAIPQIKVFPKAQTPNKKFNAEFEFYKKYDLLSVALIFVQTPRKKYPSPTDFTQYYKDISIADITNSSHLLDYPAGMNLIRWAYATAIKGNPSLTQEERLKKQRSMLEDILRNVNMITNDQVRGEFVLEMANRCETYNQIMKFKKEYEKHFVTDSQKARFAKLVANFDDNSRGSDAVDFKFSDINGKEVSLSDFKGKIVYLDFWATWCGPCLQEIPHMVKLEKEYRDNPNIVFMTVSVDKEKDKQKWINMVTKKEMKGVHLFAGEHSEAIRSSYNIQGIPRFVLIGKDGKIISSQAPRPSSSPIRILLEEALAE